MLPNWNVPIDEALPRLREYADEGDADAEIDLSTRLSFCTEHALRISEDAEQTKRRDMEEDKSDQRFDEAQRKVRAENLRFQMDQDARAREACRRVPDDARADWLTWVDRAARTGSTHAMRKYASLSTAEFDSVAAVLADPDMAIERRDKARAYLLQAGALGDVEALRDLANGYAGFGIVHIFAVDPALAYAYAYAGTLAGASRQGDMDWVMNQNAPSLDGRQLAEAEAEGRRIYEKCCAKH